MEAMRKIYRQLPETLKMPRNLRHRRVEVILLPLDVEKGSQSRSKTAVSPLACYAGALVGELLVREEQGVYAHFPLTMMLPENMVKCVQCSPDWEHQSDRMT